ncbi:MAG: hypothetical protein KJN62_03040 [Deltaproteobacteria bacterium]|nr:hypothetical protein [Deltaproteobacteria bacterium]
MKKRKNYGIVSFRMPKNEKRLIEQIATSEYRSLSRWLYMLIRNELDRRGYENATQTKLD